MTTVMGHLFYFGQCFGFLLTGVGKSTLVLKICERLKADGFSLRGFYTKERRDHGKRTGFDVVTMDGATAALARVLYVRTGLHSIYKW